MLTDKIRTSKYMALRITSLYYLMSQGCLFLQRSVCHLNGKKTSKPTNNRTPNSKEMLTAVCLSSRKSWTYLTRLLFDAFKALSQYFRFASEYIQNSPVSTQKSCNRAVF